MNKHITEMTTDELCEAILKKIQNENKEYTDSLYSMSPDEIIKHSYETTYRDEIVLLFESIDLEDYFSEKDLCNLYSQFNILESVYDEWITMDANPGDWLLECIHNVAKEEMKIRKQ